MNITNSQIKTFQRCKRQYHYKFIEGLTPKMSLSLPLRRGSWLHELLETHYKGGDWTVRNDELAQEFDRMFDEEKDAFGDLPEICANIMESYVYHWREEDSTFEVIAVEELCEAELPGGHTLKFKFDGIVEDEYGRWLMEHKSHRTIPGSTYRFIDMQTARYVWGLNEIGTYGEITGVLWNYIRTKEPTKPQLLKSGRLSSRKIDTDLLTYVQAIQEYGLDPRDYKDVILTLKRHNDFFRRERVPKPKSVIETLVKDSVIIADEIERGFEPIRSIERGCEFSCSFLDLCSVELYGGDGDDVRRSKYRKATGDDYYGYLEDTNNE